MLAFVGLGLSGDGITLQGLEEVRSADEVYAELYTSLIPGFDLEELEKKVGQPIEVLQREDVEEKPAEILKEAKDEKVVFLVPGDPMVATTHLDLRLRAKEVGVETTIIHGPSIETAAPGLAGLQSYKFGRTATLPLPRKPSETPYGVIEENGKLGLHTLLLLDIEADEERYLTADRAIEHLLNLEEELKRGVFTGETLCVVVARAGTTNPLVKAHRAQELKEMDFGPPPHAVIVPGKLHFLEAEALERFAGAPEEVVKKNVEE
ncbi:hypothetical protein AKJ65_03070 [candidate division MSBL1 archaeon SCGC-AAA259E19]|uniref:Diphthine synthase n=1 Tax=candidate division MSBL1 archaeon SCGC-AAA259E19 TaxID=1698264 RepID=A0A133UL42_9EURY|nr:hypothetical protein AKJ65_03070 [candidate division MSBL1 archaeon SCGC-AAA259E19]